MIVRLRTLLNRSVAAAKLGFIFYGTTKTKVPNVVCLRGKQTRLTFPKEGGCLHDIINVWLDDEYGVRSLESAPRTVLDVGANVGLFSLWAAHNFQNVTIHAYEPNPRVYPCLESNVTEMPVTVFRSGLGAKGARGMIIDSGESRLASTRVSEEGGIVIEPLAEAVRRLGGKVDLMKIDCEGAEWDLFEDENSWRMVEEIRMEYHLVNGHTLDEFKLKVAHLGFAIVELLPNAGFGVAWLRRQHS